MLTDSPDRLERVGSATDAREARAICASHRPGVLDLIACSATVNHTPSIPRAKGPAKGDVSARCYSGLTPCRRPSGSIEAIMDKVSAAMAAKL